METPNFYAIIPANVRYDKELNANAKLLYGEITALSNVKGYCYANNKYFADLYQVSTVSISKWINKLVELGYLKSVINYREGSKEILSRYLTLVCYPIKEKFDTPIKEKFKDNNTSINNTVNKEGKQILFSDSIWNDVNKLREKLILDLVFVKDFKGVDLKNYIEDCLAWSVSKNNKSTDNGWYMTLRQWMKRDLKANKLVKLPEKNNKPKGFTNH